MNSIHDSISWLIYPEAVYTCPWPFIMGWESEKKNSLVTYIAALISGRSVELILRPSHATEFTTSVNLQVCVLIAPFITSTAHISNNLDSKRQLQEHPRG